MIIGDLIKPGNWPGYARPDGQGRRFANEYMQAMSRYHFDYLLLNYDPATGTFPRIPCDWFFDERRMALGAPVATELGPVAHGHDDWSYGIERKSSGAGSVGERASRRQRPRRASPTRSRRPARSSPDNEACPTGEYLFGRPVNSLGRRTRRRTTACRCTGRVDTSGGPRRTEFAQALDASGEPIRAATRRANWESRSAEDPCNGANISDCLRFGQIAAEHALGKLR